MSHLSKIKTRIIDTEVLLKTLTDLNIEHEQNPDTNSNKPCVKLNNNLMSNSSSYAVFTWQNDTYQLEADSAVWQDKRLVEFWNEKIQQKYAYNMILKEGFKQGFNEIQTSSTNKADGSIRLVLEKWS
uniref:Uncharacterized protein ycf35 n=1 Tax=Dermonema virens TaxID=1077399 RepID=A0A1G4NRG9_9FLOR|nr:Hypothetical protein ycf35 [Dermonema virens]SCW21252.1 Hypothetical protein ycf35 [Dermonema virens]